VTLCLKGGIAEPEEAATAMQRFAKHAPAVTNMHAIIKELLEAVFSIGLRRGYVMCTNGINGGIQGEAQHRKYKGLKTWLRSSIRLFK
jgi:hypothetical protein